jgi:Flp pilus assembly protein TadD
VHYTLGVTLWQQGNFAEAEEQLRAATNAKPDYAEAYYTLGTVLKQDGKLDDAVAALRQALVINPDLIGAHTNLAAIYRQQGKTANAEAETRRGQELLKQSNSVQTATFNTNSGKKLLEAGDLDGAITQFRSAITIAPNYAPAHRYLAQALERKGDKEEAGRELQKASELAHNQAQ